VSLVLGDDGSKSTLMRLLAGALIAQGGRLIVQDLDLPPRARATASRWPGATGRHRVGGLVRDRV
jgi:ABC-type sugar transport system ATPase subunit